MSYVNQVNDNGNIYDIWDKRFGEGSAVFDGTIQIVAGQYDTFTVPSSAGVYKLIRSGYSYGIAFCNPANTEAIVVSYSGGVFHWPVSGGVATENGKTRDGTKLYLHTISGLSGSQPTSYVCKVISTSIYPIGSASSFASAIGVGNTTCVKATMFGGLVINGNYQSGSTVNVRFIKTTGEFASDDVTVGTITDTVTQL